MPIYWNTEAIRRHMARRGLENANQLREYAGLTIATAYNVLTDPPPEVERIETRTLETLQRAFGLKSPWSLLEWRRR